MNVDEVVAREAIRDLIARYNANGDSGRFEQAVSLFAPDAVVETPNRTYTGSEEISLLFTGTGASMREAFDVTSIRHHTSTHQITIQGPDEASSYCYYQVLIGDHGLDHWGRYIDRFTRRDGKWLFSRRRILRDGGVPGGWSESR